MKRIVLFIILLLLFSSIVFSLENELSFTNIFSNSTGSSFFITEKLSHKVSYDGYSLGANINYANVSSSLSVVQGDVNEGQIGFDYNTEKFYIKPGLLFANSKEVNINVEKNKFSVQDINLFGGKIEALINFNGFRFLPFIYGVNLSSGEGNLYYFFGHPEIPCLFCAGFSGYINENHHFTVSYTAGNIEVLSNEDQLLFSSGLNNVFVSYDFSYAKNEYKINSCLAYNYGNLHVIGGLSKQNQKYLGFPFSYFNLDFQSNIHLLLTSVNFTYNKERINLETAIDCLVVLNNKNDYFADWKYKKNLLYDGSIGKENGQLSSLAGNGIFILSFSGSFCVTKQIDKCIINLDKKFVIPFGDMFYDAKFNLDKELIISYLLSGITVGCVVKL